MADMIEEDEEGKVDESWLATFADLSTLLLTFFVLLYSMSSVDAKKFDATFSSIRGTFGGNEMEFLKSRESQESEADFVEQSVRIREEILEQQREMYNQIRSFITQQALENEVTAIFDNGKIILRVPNDILFGKGSELLSARAEKALKALLSIFHEKRDQKINIKGYSDNSPIPQGSRFYDNWELSALRSVNILRYYLNEGIESHRITATGMGSLDPLFPNTTEENKAKNRRVEFVLELDSEEK